MLVNRLAAIKTLSSTFLLNASPYVAVQLDGFKIYRTCATGLISSADFTASDVYAELNHFLDCCHVLNDTEIEINLDPSGVLCVSSTEATYGSELRVHSVGAAQAGFKAHQVGREKLQFPFDIFQGLDTKPFKLAAPPVVCGGRVMLATTMGLVFWSGPSSLASLKVSPRLDFLSFVAAHKPEGIVITEKGYWGAISSKLVMFSAAHSFGQQLFDSYQVVGEKVAELPAFRLLYTLKAAAFLCGNNDKISFHSDVSVRDRFGNTSKFGLGIKATWPTFYILPNTASLIVDALSQDKEEVVTLYSIPLGAHPTMRCTRGSFEVDFKVF